jgi:hypothetical protein
MLRPDCSENIERRQLEQSGANYGVSGGSAGRLANTGASGPAS